MLINKRHTKLFTLHVASKRAHKFTRVSQEFLDHVDFKIKEYIVKYVETLPSKGKTII